MKKLSLLLVGFFFSGLLAARAASLPAQSAFLPAGVTQQAGALQGNMTQQVPNTDRFNFVIANPNTVDPKKFIFEIRPGEETQDYVLVKNASDVPLKFSLYGADGTKTLQGTFALKTKGETQTDIGKWITFEDSGFTLQPGETKRVKFTLSVPVGTPEGSYSGGVAAEKSKPDINNPNIIIAVRIALRVDVKVTANPQPVPKQYAETAKNPFTEGYFWASLMLFVVSAGALAWSYFSEKKPGHHRGNRQKRKK